jgi:hypothetical protein
VSLDLALELFIRPPLEEAEDAFSRPAIASTLACRYLVAIGLQESGMIETIQRGAGGKPLLTLARSWWQFERKGGVDEVVAHRQLGWCRTQILKMGYPLDAQALHFAMANDQRLGALMARGLLWIDPAPLADDEEAAWATYLRRWRPGKPHRERWGSNWREAGEAVARMPQDAQRPVVPSLPPYQPMPEPDEAGRWLLARSRGNRPAYWTGAVAVTGLEAPCVSYDPRMGAVFASSEEAVAAAEEWPGVRNEYRPVRMA